MHECNDVCAGICMDEAAFEPRDDCHRQRLTVPIYV